MYVPCDWIPSESTKVDLERWNRKTRRIALLLNMSSKGQLSAYALSCGYVQACGNVTLYHDGCYHVRDSNTRLWESFPTLGQARMKFKELIGGYNASS